MLKVERLISLRPLVDLIKFFGLMALLIWFVINGSQELGYHWQWYRVPEYLFSFEQGGFVPGPLLKGLAITVKITLASFVLAFVFGVTGCVFRLSSSFLARTLARVYVETIRNTPLLIQILFIYFVLSPILNISPFFSAVLALSLFEGAYASEIIRSGILSIAAGQWEAAQSIGMTKSQIYRTIIFPQAFRIVLPPLTSQAVSLLKDSSLVSTIALYDLTMQGQVMVANTYLAFETWFTVAAIYLALSLFIVSLVTILERRMSF